MINLDKWYSAREFAGFLSVHPLSIYQSQPHLGSCKLPIAVPAGIRIGRSVRWTGRQICDYQSSLAELSGVALPRASTAEHELSKTAFSKPEEKKAGRPRSVAAGEAS